MPRYRSVCRQASPWPAPETCTPGTRMIPPAVIAGVVIVGESEDRRERLRHAIHAHGLQRLRQSEVQHFHCAVFAHLDVARLQVAMDDALLMRGFESSGNLAGQRDRFVHRQRVPIEPFRQRRTLYEFQYETRGRMVFTFEILQAVDRTNVRMVQQRKDLCLALEPREPLGISGKGGGRILIAT